MPLFYAGFADVAEALRPRMARPPPSRPHGLGPAESRQPGTRVPDESCRKTHWRTVPRATALLPEKQECAALKHAIDGPSSDPARANADKNVAVFTSLGEPIEGDMKA
jgi:hypothetical protein